MQESEKLANQQVTRDLCWLSGILDGEGSIILGTYTRKDKTKQYYTRICFYNSDEDVINKVTKVLDFLEIAHHVESRLQYGNLGNREGFTVTIGKLESIVKLLELIKEDLTCKKTRAELLIKFCKKRLEHKNKPLDEDESNLLCYWNENIKTKS